MLQDITIKLSFSFLILLFSRKLRSHFSISVSVSLTLHSLKEMKTNFNETKHFALTATYICHFCVQQNEYSLRRFSVPRILRCPAIIIFFPRLLVISGFGRNLGLTHLALMSYFYGSDARQDELRLSQTALL